MCILIFELKQIIFPSFSPTAMCISQEAKKIYRSGTRSWKNCIYANAYQSAQKSTIFSVILINFLKNFKIHGNVFKTDMTVLCGEGGYGLPEGYSFLAQSIDISRETNFIEFPMNFQYRH